jgi:hypothetical protein
MKKTGRATLIDHSYCHTGVRTRMEVYREPMQGGKLELPSCQAAAGSMLGRIPVVDARAVAAATGATTRKGAGAIMDMVCRSHPPAARWKWEPPPRRVFSWDGKGLEPLVKLPFDANGRPVIPPAESHSERLAKIDRRLARAVAKERRKARRREVMERSLLETERRARLAMDHRTDRAKLQSFLHGLKPLPEAPFPGKPREEDLSSALRADETGGRIARVLVRVPYRNEAPVPERAHGLLSDHLSSQSRPPPRRLEPLSVTEARTALSRLDYVPPKVHPRKESDAVVSKQCGHCLQWF